MNKLVKKLSASTLAGLSVLASTLPVYAAEAEEVIQVADATGPKAYAAAITIAVAALAGALAMGLAISKAAEGVAKQPEASSKIQTILMLGLVFIETAIIYALIIAILIIFVL